MKWFLRASIGLERFQQGILALRSDVVLSDKTIFILFMTVDRVSI